MGSLYLGQDRGVRYGLAVSRTGCGNVDMGWLYLGQDMSVSVCAYMGWLNVGQDRCVSVRAGCI
jgi:hypothetical protein